MINNKKIFWIQIYYKTVSVNFSKNNRMKMKNNNSKFRLNNIADSIYTYDRIICIEVHNTSCRILRLSVNNELCCRYAHSAIKYWGWVPIPNIYVMPLGSWKLTMSAQNNVIITF